MLISTLLNHMTDLIRELEDKLRREEADNNYAIGTLTQIQIMQDVDEIHSKAKLSLKRLRQPKCKVFDEGGYA